MLRSTIIAVTSLVFLLFNPGQVYSQAEPFISFNVQPAMDGTVIIQWKALPGTDTFYFEVERSRDMKTWESIAHVTSQLSHQYSSIDPLPGLGLIYYRVRQAGAESHSFYTRIEWVQISNTGKLYIWPNPAKDMLHVRTPYASGSIEVLNPDGKLMLKISMINVVTDVPISRLSGGIYFLHVKHNQEDLVERFVKE
ncbi:MAG: T9SS type A sorting domain-containing protein [Chitinophagales bacterium]